MQVAKATPEDIKATFSVNNILELLQSNQMPEDWLEETDGDDWFDKGSDAQCATAMRKLLETINTGAVFRVAMGMSVLTDQANKIINQDSDVLEFHPEIVALKADAARYQYIKRHMNQENEELGCPSGTEISFYEWDEGGGTSYDPSEYDDLIDSLIAQENQSGDQS